MLHIINKSPFQSPAFTTCLRFINQQDVILLIEDGVYAAIELTLAQHTIYALKEDIQARGLIDKLNSIVKLIDYAGFVNLTLTHHPIQTWS